MVSDQPTRNKLDSLLQVRAAANHLAISRKDPDLFRAVADGDDPFILTFLKQEKTKLEERIKKDEAVLEEAPFLVVLVVQLELDRHKATLQGIRELCELGEQNANLECELKGLPMVELLQLL